MRAKSSRQPHVRKLRAYAFDPSLSRRIDTAGINEIVYKVPWENDLAAGPIGDYLEVIDYDPTIKRFYAPVDLNDMLILAEDGLDPSESNPKFHQQMVYAVAMTTIKNFESALGRKVLWSTRLLADHKAFETYVPKLRIYPHALRDANAYYSPQKKALLFGYFSAAPANRVLQMPNSLVLTCLSHDIIAHETTHAILDGMHRGYNRATNADVLAFHEAFADIVALFQHFTFPDVLKHQIAKTKGDLATENLLAQLAQEFGPAIGGYGSLRDAIGRKNPKTGEWERTEPDADAYQTVFEPHARGSILVSAVFEAFITIYQRRVRDLLRIATSGSGILAPGEIHPDLVNRLAKEASKAAGHILHMCIRALDYCPPVDITFGDFLRAIVTADMDLVDDDKHDYRLAFIDAFRRRGIYPEGITTMGIDSLRFPALDAGIVTERKTGEQATSEFKMNVDVAPDVTAQDLFVTINEFLRDYGDKIKYVNDREEIYNITRDYIVGGKTDSSSGLHERIGGRITQSGSFETSADFSAITGLAFCKDHKALGVRRSSRYKGPSFEIRNLRLVARVGPDGNQINNVVFSIIQRAGVIVKDNAFAGIYVPDSKEPPDGGFEFRGGCTLIFDLDTLKLKYAISKPLIDRQALDEGRFEINQGRLMRQYEYQNDEGPMHLSEYSQYFGGGKVDQLEEPFAFLHRR